MKKCIATSVFVLFLFVTIPVYAITRDDIINACKSVSNLAKAAFEMGYEGYPCQSLSETRIRIYLTKKNINIDALDIDRIRKQLVALCESGRLNRLNKRKYRPISSLDIRYQFRLRCLEFPELMILKIDGAKSE